MGLMVKRLESAEEIKITYKPYFIYLIGISLIFSLLADEFENFIALSWLSSLSFTTFFLLFLFNAKEMFTSRRELMKAMKNGSISASGSRFSFKNPMVYTIPKAK